MVKSKVDKEEIKEVESMMESIRISVIIPKYLVDILDGMKSQFSGRTRSVLIRKAIQEFIKKGE